MPLSKAQTVSMVKEEGHDTGQPGLNLHPLRVDMLENL